VNFTSEQVQRYTRAGVYFLAGYLAQRGMGIDNKIIDQLLPFLMVAVNLIWTIYGNRINAKLAAIAAYAKDPNTPVVGIVTTPNPEGRALATKIEGPVAPAGSLEAKDIAGTAHREILT